MIENLCLSFTSVKSVCYFKMIIEINNEAQTVNTNISATEIFSLLEIKNTNGYALAVNNNVIPKSEWSETILKENDKVLVIQATQGG